MEKSEEFDINSEFECPICNDILFHPITINCGHTFCKDCLANCLKTKQICPICRYPTFLTHNLKENIAITNLIRSKFPKIIEYRENRENKENKELNKEITYKNVDFTKFYNDYSQYSEDDSITFSNFITIKSDKDYLFPGLIDIIKIKLTENDITPEFFLENLCKDNKFICFSNKTVKKIQKSSFFFGVIVKCNKFQTKDNRKIEMEVKIIERVQIFEIKNFLVRGNTKNNDFFWSTGKIFKDCKNIKENSHQDIDQIAIPICNFYSQQLNSISTKSPNTFIKILKKIGEIHKINMDNSSENFETLSNFSFLIAGTLNAKIDEKKRMFETDNVIERLVIAKNILARHKDNDVDPSQVFDVDKPAQKLYSIRYSILLIVIIGFVLYFFKSNDKLN